MIFKNTKILGVLSTKIRQKRLKKDDLKISATTKKRVTL